MAARIEKIPKKEAADFLIEAGLSKYMSAMITKYIEAHRLTRENNQPAQTNRFNTFIRKYTGEKGLKIGDIF